MATHDSETSRRRRFTAGGVDVTLLAGSDDTAGGWSLFEYAAEPGFEGPPPHWHEEMIEGVYVLDGGIRVTIDGDDRPVGPGEYVHVPTHTLHSFVVDDAEPTRFLLHVSPGGFEGYFEELEALVDGADHWPLPDMRPVQELMSRYDTHAPPVRPAG